MQEAQHVLKIFSKSSRPPYCYVSSIDYVMLEDCNKEPSCYEEAMLSNDKLKLERAMQLEMDFLHKNKDLPPTNGRNRTDKGEFHHKGLLKQFQNLNRHNNQERILL